MDVLRRSLYFVVSESVIGTHFRRFSGTTISDKMPLHWFILLPLWEGGITQFFSFSKLSLFPSSVFHMPYTFLWTSVRDLQQIVHGWFLFVSLTWATFDKIKFPVLMHVKPPDDAGLEELIPSVWWATLENVSVCMSLWISSYHLGNQLLTMIMSVLLLIVGKIFFSLIIHKINVKSKKLNKFMFQPMHWTFKSGGVWELLLNSTFQLNVLY